MQSAFKPHRHTATAIALMLGVHATVFAQVAGVNVEAEFDAQARMMRASPEGPPAQPWLQHIDGQMIDTTRFKKNGPYTLCFSNASVSNSWRVVGWNTMQAEIELNHADIRGFEYTDAQGKDEKQIADIRSLVNSGKCDALIVSPNTSAAVTPVVEEACKVLPVVTFDRSVNSTCPVTAIRSIGGYAWGKVGADFIAAHAPQAGKVLALRTAAGVDLFETRWAAAKKVFDDAGLTVVGSEFVGGDRARAKSAVTDYLSRIGKIDAVWVDLGDVSAAAAEAFEDAGQPYPVITGEDIQDYLRAWQKHGFQGIAPTYPAYQWRTAVIAALNILKGEPVPSPDWVLPQPFITAANLDKYVDTTLPPLHYSMCGCEDMPNYPQRWGGKR